MGQYYMIGVVTKKGNGRGGGDYWGSDQQYVGSWANNLLSIVQAPPKGYTIIKPNFIEN